MIRISYAPTYHKFLKELLGEVPDLEEEIKKRIKWFCKKPSDERLANHLLHGKLKNLWAFGITGDIRILYKWLDKNKVRFLAIGGHSKVYAKKTN